MENKDLLVRYSNLKDKLKNLDVEKVKLETRIETIEKRQAELEKEIKKIAVVDSIKDAIKKEKALKDKLDRLMLEAEELFND